MKKLFENWRRHVNEDLESDIRTVLSKEGGTTDISVLMKHTGATEEEIKSAMGDWKDVGEYPKIISEDKSISDKELEELKTIKDELYAASKMHKGQAERIESIIKGLVEEELEAVLNEKSNFFANMRAKQKRCKGELKTGDCAPKPPSKQAWKKITAEEKKKEFYEVDAKDINEEYCPVCQESQLEEKKKRKKKKKKPCKKAKGKNSVKRVNGKCRSFGQAGKAKDGGRRIRPGTAKGDAYCARSAGIKKCKNPPCANTLSRRKWKCRGKKSVAE